MIFDELNQKKTRLALIGLGYVGLPIALAFAKKISVVGFDISEERIAMMKKGTDPSKELDASAFEGCDIEFTASVEVLKKASFYIVAVPTPIDEHNLPNLNSLLNASKTIGSILKKGDYVVYESTVYPGCTEEDCIPVLEKESGLRVNLDFKVGYSPERINPGDTQHTLAKVVKIVSGCDAEALGQISKVYRLVIEAGLHLAPTIKVAEAAKCIENTQRDVNIALINELSIIFSKMGINTYDVLDSAGSKWNFLNFKPGLVGGHCIGVDPYYLSYKAMGYGYHAQVINSGRYVNDSMGFYIAKQTVKQITNTGKQASESKVLIMGATFKQNVSDIRNSRVADIVKGLRSYEVNVHVTDPRASSGELNKEYGFCLREKIDHDYHAVIVAVNHSEYLNMDENYFKSIMVPNGILIDIKGIYRNKINQLHYWSL